MADPEHTTIAAIATPRGEGGIGIIRISGPMARIILDRSFKPASKAFKDYIPWRLHRGMVLDENGNGIDDGLAVFMPGPKTFTGEDVAELHCHGGSFLMEKILDAIFHLGAVPARRGEFSKRGFLNGRMDLCQAEAIAEIISAPSREALDYGFKRLKGSLGDRVTDLRTRLDELRMRFMAEIDFSEEETGCTSATMLTALARKIVECMDNLLRGTERANTMQAGAKVVLAGPVNAGKSSILNSLAGNERALVTEHPGTTRDYIEVQINLDGVPVRLVDTAGFRNMNDADPVERLGMEKSRNLLKTADVVLLVLDSSVYDDSCKPELLPEHLHNDPASVITVFNKHDLSKLKDIPNWVGDCSAIMASAKNGYNMDSLAEMIRNKILSGKRSVLPDNGVAPNKRQAMLLKSAREEVVSMINDIENGITLDCAAARLDMATSCLEKILGLSAHDELLEKIFSQFCIGK